ncbi:MAG: hypothetical protein KDK78_06935, partial [Chlamydiia bacterium]|nr:hypothetical protein [Chlamydiia bacterium]
LNDPSHSKASLNVLWTLFTEFSRIRDAAEMDLHYEQEVELRLVERHSDLLSTRTKIHFDAIEGEISPEVREVCHHATRKIHFLLAHSCLPLPGLDGEAQNRLVAFFHAVENLIAGLSDWILGSSREERDSKATMYLDVIDSVQRANIVDLRNQDYSSFMTRIKHLEEFLDVVQDRIPGELIDDFETECMYFETRVMEPQLFEERVQGIVDALSALNVPDSHLGIVQECMAELMTLELPLEDAEIQLSSSQSVGSIIMRLSDVVERLQKLLEPSTHYLPSGLPASKPSKVR